MSGQEIKKSYFYYLFLYVSLVTFWLSFTPPNDIIVLVFDKLGRTSGVHSLFLSVSITFNSNKLLDLFYHNLQDTFLVISIVILYENFIKINSTVLFKKKKPYFWKLWFSFIFNFLWSIIFKFTNSDCHFWVNFQSIKEVFLQNAT